MPLPPQSLNLNASVERWVCSVKEEALSRLILFGERSLWYVLTAYVTHFHHERPHQGKGHVGLIPAPSSKPQTGRHSGIQCCARLGGLLKFYDREAA